jgi:GT2 family glycosyltransferase
MVRQKSVKLSFIIASRNRANALRQCLNSIAAAVANAAPLDAEIIAVDNCSSDNTREVLDSWAAAAPITARVLQEPKVGLARAQNRALREARGDLLVFTDDDCCLHPRYVGDLLRHDSKDDGLVLRGGRIELGDTTDLPLTINTSPQQMRWTRGMKSARHNRISGCLNGCNMAMRRALFERIGPLDETFGPGSYIGSGSDSDLIFRAYLAGVTLEYVPDMIVFHHHGRKSAESAYQLMRRYMIANGALFVRYLFRHPDLCRVFYGDMRDAARRIVRRKSIRSPETLFSDLDLLACAALGAIRYLSTRPMCYAAKSRNALRDSFSRQLEYSSHS